MDSLTDTLDDRRSQRMLVRSISPSTGTLTHTHSIRTHLQCYQLRLVVTLANNLIEGVLWGGGVAAAAAVAGRWNADGGRTIKDAGSCDHCQPSS